MTVTRYQPAGSIRGSRIQGVDQPGFERILRITLSNPVESLHLYVEIMGRHSNLILVDGEGVMKGIITIDRDADGYLVMRDSKSMICLM